MRYLYKFLIFSFSLLFAVGSINYIIDPYQIYYSDRFHQLNMEKPSVYSTLRLHRAYAINHRQPESIIIGSSKVNQGYNPDSVHIPYNNVYNLGLVLATADETYNYIQHSAGTGELKSVVLAVDLFSYNAYLPNRTDFDKARLNSSRETHDLENYSPPPTFVSFSDLMPTLFSLSALKASIDTLFNSEVGDRPLFLANGQENPQTLQNELNSMGGHHTASLIIERQFANSFIFPAPYYQFDFVSNDGVDTLTTFADILRLSHTENLDLRIVINPAHVTHYAMYQKMGLWNYFEQWKRELVGINEHLAEELGIAAFPIWDFTSVNAITTEPIPHNPGETISMSYFWESSHFKTIVGEYILGKVFDSHSDNELERWPENFGIQINHNILDQHLTKVRSGLERYIMENTERLEPFMKIFEEAIEERELIISRLQKSQE